MTLNTPSAEKQKINTKGKPFFPLSAMLAANPGLLRFESSTSADIPEFPESVVLTEELKGVTYHPTPHGRERWTLPAGSVVTLLMSGNAENAAVWGVIRP